MKGNFHVTENFRGISFSEKANEVEVFGREDLCPGGEGEQEQ